MPVVVDHERVGAGAAHQLRLRLRDLLLVDGAHADRARAERLAVVEVRGRGVEVLRRRRGGYGSGGDREYAERGGGEGRGQVADADHGELLFVWCCGADSEPSGAGPGVTGPVTRPAPGRPWSSRLEVPGSFRVPRRRDAAYFRRMRHATGIAHRGRPGGPRRAGRVRDRRRRAGRRRARRRSPRSLTLLDPFGRRGRRPRSPTRCRGCPDGALQIRVVSAEHGGTDYEAATIQDVQDGRADLAVVGARAWDEFGAPRSALSAHRSSSTATPSRSSVLTSEHRRDDAPAAAGRTSSGSASCRDRSDARSDAARRLGGTR